jgi:copper homeostasis protein
MIFELAAFNLNAVRIGAENSVSRIEFCDDYTLGGITPDLESCKIARDLFGGELIVMIRCRGGNFVYNQNEIDKMLLSIDQMKIIGVDGFVFGCLTADNHIDQISANLLLNATGNVPVTFHRAIDKVADYQEGIKSLIDLGVKRVLTSGHSGSATEGKEQLKMIQEIYGERIEIVGGGAVRSGNAKALVDYTGLTSVHSAAITSADFIPDPKEVLRIMQQIGLKDE